ncbi:MAG: DUF4214 domain-containing protein [Desulfobulbaceae bacterium]|nr:DUF4214 domain-containing protein [Desulfobulbaceae bacterium]
MNGARLLILLLLLFPPVSVFPAQSSIRVEPLSSFPFTHDLDNLSASESYLKAPGIAGVLKIEAQNREPATAAPPADEADNMALPLDSMVTRRIGVALDVPWPDSIPSWQKTADGGSAAHYYITSEGAAAIRIGLQINNLPSEAELRFYSPGNTDHPVLFVAGSKILASIARNMKAREPEGRARMYWSPVVAGECAGLEIYVPPGVDSNEIDVAIPLISHLLANVDELSSPTTVSLAQWSDTCEIDYTCYEKEWPEGKAVALLKFTEDGYTYSCTGTLLNNSANDFAPYFLTAAHCISSQSSASSLITQWFYRSSSCGALTADPDGQTLSGGALLLQTDLETDTSLVLLNDNPPSGAEFSGWSAQSDMVGETVTAIHHPHSSMKKISFGAIDSLTDCPSISSTVNENICYPGNSGNYYDVTFYDGVVGSGSSGSPIFIDTGRYLVGTLMGAISTCMNQPAVYGRFDIAYANGLHQWLDPQTGENSGCSSRFFSPTEINVINSYIAYYGRPADPEGLAYWSQIIENEGGSANRMADIRYAFVYSREYFDRYGGLITSSAMIENIYRQLFNRLPDPEGLAYWLNQLNTGAVNFQDLADSILYGARGNDITVLENKRRVARHVISFLETTGLPYPDSAYTILGPVDDTATAEGACGAYLFQ